MLTTSNSEIAFFDFDGTLTSKDTLAQILKFTKGSFRYYTGLLILSPVLIGYKLRIISNQRAKEILLTYFLKGMPIEKFDAICKEFIENELPALFRKVALHEVRHHILNDTKVVIISASPENWILPWCQQYNIECIATKLAVKNGKITGKIAGKNCHGDEKVKNILKRYNLSNYNKIHAYGDTRGDLPMLSLATNKYYKPFKNEVY
ncbi:MAG TPA: HAD-IB family hydrolase [Flavipsychrobacter sp.]|nr:HAD-IB family hydrolase [Flavipsychrobacter sp.]